MIESKELALKIARLLKEKKAIDVTVIDISPKASFADYIEDMLEPQGVFPKSVEGKRSSGWILMDYGDVVINVMTVATREKYNIERIWGDCDNLEID